MDHENESNGFEFEPADIFSAPEQPLVQSTQQPEAVQKQPASPFADSPYVMEHQPQQAASPAQEVPVAPQPQPQQSSYYDPNAWQEAPPVAPAAKPKAKKSGGKAWKAVVAAVLTVALVVTGCGITAFAVNSYWAGQVQMLQQSFEQKLEELQEQIKDNSYTGNGNSVSGSVNTSSDGLTPGQVYARNVKSVVAVSATDTGNGGSGFIISENGYIVSNYHVVGGASRVTITTNDEQQYDAKVVGYDAANDVAVLKVEATGLQAAVIGSSDDLIVGDQVVAIGHPLGNETATLTVGYVSAKDQAISTDGSIINMLQTDAAINSGNSGGPLFNMKGEVVGITTAKYSGTTTSGASIESIGFAIPIDDVVLKLQDLMDYGYITGAYLGVSVMDMDSSVLDAFGFPEGAYVAETTPGYCAQKAGVQAKDMIVAVGEYQVDSVNGLTRALQKFKAGDETTITVWRAGAQLVFPITLDEKPVPTGSGEVVDDSVTVEPDATESDRTGIDDWLDRFFGDRD